MTNEEIYQYLQNIDHRKFVLHGSKHALPTIEPRQAFHASGIEEMNLCAVYATQLIEIGLLYAVIRDKEWGWTTYFDHISQLRMAYALPAGKADLEDLQLSRGYIHVLPCNGFTYLKPGVICFNYDCVTANHILEIKPSILSYLCEREGVRFFRQN